MTVPAPKPEPALDLPDFRSFIRGRPCLACIAEGEVWFGCDAAHVHTRRNAGDKANLIPLCRTHHSEQHRIGIKSFALKHGLDLEASAENYWRYWIHVYQPAF